MPTAAERLRETVEHLAAIERPSASPGECQAAEWIAARLTGTGAPARVEVERAHGTYWIPLGLLSAAAAAAGLAARGGRRRRLAALTGALAAAGIADDVSAGPHVLRRALPHRDTYNVVAEVGDPDAARTIVFIAHHDAARGGLIFAPEFVTIPADRFPRWFERQETSPPVMRLVIAGPALVAIGAAAGVDLARAAGTVIALGAAAAFTDIALRKVVPGANDNLSSVAVLLELAHALRERPVAGVRVLLVSTGSEESSMEGMRGFIRRHRAALPVDRTEMFCLESVGSPELIVIEGEGMLVIRDYPERARERVARAARAAGIHLRRGLRLGLATDGLIALRAGYPTATIASITKYKFPGHYHSQQDIPANISWDTVERAARLCETLVRSPAD